MSIGKNNQGEESATPTGQETDVEAKDASQAGRGQGIEIVSLKIADELDSGGDPYNRTGSFCIIKKRDDD
jgi:hypothetical protein